MTETNTETLEGNGGKRTWFGGLFRGHSTPELVETTEEDLVVSLVNSRLLFIKYLFYI